MNLLSYFMLAAPVVAFGTTKVPEMIYLQEENIRSKLMEVDLTTAKSVGINAVGFSYLGMRGQMPDLVEIDWNENLRELWDQKLEIKDVSGATKTSADDIVLRYYAEDPEQISIKDHMSQVDHDLTDIKRTMRWGDICIKFKMDSSNCYQFIKTAYQVDAKSLTAYSMTELMPYRDGVKSYAMMSVYFEKAGRNFLDSIPALGDRYMSMGRYQFTSFAVGSDKDGPRPANMIANYSNVPIPGSVTKLYGLDSDRAAYYFSTYNLMMLFRAMDDKDVAKYAAHCSRKKGEITEYIATAHHNPKWARKRALQWVRAKCAKPLIDFQGDRLKVYSIKTAENLRALDSAA